MSDVVHRVPVYERVAVIAVALIPACGWGIAAVLHTGYVPRYGSAGTFGLAVLAAFTVYVLGAACSVWPRLIATGAMVWFIGSFAFSAGQWSSQSPIANSYLPLLVSAAATGRPVVISNGLEFLPLAYYLPPETAKRMVFVGDENLAIRNTGANLIDSALLRARALLSIRGHIEHYRDFLQQNKRFWLFCPAQRSEEWIYRQLQLDGAALRPYAKDYLYDVMVDRDRRNPASPR